MSVTITNSPAYRDGCNYDDCLISSFLKTLFLKLHGTKSEFDYTISKQVKQVKNDLAKLNTTGVTEMSYDYISAMEKMLPRVAFRYVVIHKNNSPVLFAYYQLHTITSQNFNPDQNKGLTKGILGFFLDLKKAKVLVSGNAMRNDTAAFIYDSKVLSYEQAVEGLVAGAEKIAAEECTTALVLRDITESAQLAEKGYRKPFDDKTMTLGIDGDWRTLNDYINELTRKYKTRANKALEAGKQLTTVMLTEKQVIQYEAEMAGMFNSLTQQQAFVLTETGDRYFSTLKKLYQDAFEVVAFFDGSRLLAFYTAFVTADAYEMYYIGLDYSSNAEYQLYFNMLFSGVDRAITLKKKQLKLGRTSFDAKASLGAKPESLNYLVKLSHIPDFVLQRFVRYFSAMEDGKWKLRHPLKNEQPATENLSSLTTQ